MRLFENGPVVILVDDSDHQYGRSLNKVSSEVCSWNFQLCGMKRQKNIKIKMTSL